MGETRLLLSILFFIYKYYNTLRFFCVKIKRININMKELKESEELKEPNKLKKQKIIRL